MILADTGFFVALGNRKDNYHSQAMQQLLSLKELLLTTYPVIVEASYLLLERSGQETQFRFLNQLTQGSIEIFQLDNNHLQRMIQLMRKYANLPMDLADASLVILAEESEENRILTTDFRDFSVYRWNNNNEFINLLNQ